jgi:O-antigen/teichoic acid export membrane protein
LDCPFKSLRPSQRGVSVRSHKHWFAVLGGSAPLANQASGRSRERYRRAALSALTAFGARAVGLLTTLVSVPIVLHHVGAVQFGLWVAITSLMMILSFTDLGLGNGLINAVAEANGREDRSSARAYVSNALALLICVAICAAIAFVFVGHAVPWGRFFNVSTSRATHDAATSIAVLFACLVVGLPLGLVQRIQLGYQEAFWSNLWAALGSVLSLGAIVAAVHLDAGLPWLVAATAGVPLIPALLNGVILFGRQRPWLRPRLRDVRAAMCGRLLKTGLAFFVLQLSIAVAYQSDALIVSHVLGAAEVPQYAVPMRAFLVLQVGLVLILSPLWPAYGESIARGDIAWAERTLRRSLALCAAIGVPASVVLALLARPVIHLWVGSAVHPSILLIVGLAAWTVVASFSSGLAMFLNGADLVGVQALLAAAMAAANLVLSVVLTRGIGVSGVVYGSLIAQVAFVLIPLSLLASRLLARLRTRPPVPAPVGV